MQEHASARTLANSQQVPDSASNVTAFKRNEQTDFDVIVVGAGLSGIGVGFHLQRDCPNKSYVILEGREALGGTWDLFRYPGIRSDSDMNTLGFRFRPWRGEKAIADGPSILTYLNDTARENGIDRKIRYNHKVKRASWSSADARWTLDVEGPAGPLTFTCNFLQMCSGYYDYDGGYMPGWTGMDRFKGETMHPQKWPEDLDYAGKRVVVIGSGATAVTLVPAMTDKAAHVTMLQRSPTYMVSRPAKDAIANWLRAKLPERTAYWMTRWKNVLLQMYFYNLARKKPEGAKKRLIEMAKAELGDGIDMEKHFTPRYNPWDQRLCLLPDGDMFKVIREGKASDRHRRDRDLYRDRHQAEVRRGTAGRHHRHRNRPRGPHDGRRADHGRRQGDRSRHHAELQGHDVLRHPEPCLHLRLHQRILDPEGGSDRRISLPHPQQDGSRGICLLHAAQPRS